LKRDRIDDLINRSIERFVAMNEKDSTAKAMKSDRKQDSIAFESDSIAFESLARPANLEDLTSEGTCTVVLHPGDVLEYDPAEYSISEKNFQVKYECTIDRKHRLRAKKSATQQIISGLEKVQHVISGKKKQGMEYIQRKINELPDADAKSKVLAASGLRTQAGMECDHEKEHGPLPTLLRSQGMVAEKVKKTTTIDWQDVEAAYTYGYLKKHMPGMQLTQSLRNSYGHLDDDMDKAVFIQYRSKGWPEAWLCVLVEDNGKRATFVKSLNAHAESGKKEASWVTL